MGKDKGITRRDQDYSAWYLDVIARADLLEKLEGKPEELMDEDDEEVADVEGDETDAEEDDAATTREERHPRLGSRENFWGS